MLEAMTYRFRGHSMADPELYRSKDEVTERRADDPIDHVFGKLEEAGILDQAGYRRLIDEIEAEVEEAVRFAEESPDPAPEALYEDVYRGIEGTGTTAPHSHRGQNHG
jgi:pyruvate dehydrogenase E1 component alpha subunit